MATEKNEEITVKNEIELAKQQLLLLCQQSNNNKKTDIIKAVKKEILKARKAGRTWKQIATALAEAGVEVAVATLQYATQIKGKKTEVVKVTTVKKQTVSKKEPEKKGSVPPVLPPGQFIIKPDRGADL